MPSSHIPVLGFPRRSSMMSIHFAGRQLAGRLIAPLSAAGASRPAWALPMAHAWLLSWLCFSNSQPPASRSGPPCTRTAGTASCRSLAAAATTEARRPMAGLADTSARSRFYSSPMCVSPSPTALRTAGSLPCYIIGGQQHCRASRRRSGRSRAHKRPS